MGMVTCDRMSSPSLRRPPDHSGFALTRGLAIVVTHVILAGQFDHEFDLSIEFALSIVALEFPECLILSHSD